MKHDYLSVEFDGTEVPELYDDLLSLEVELDDELAGMCRISIALLPGSDGSWPYLDDKRFAVWGRMSVTAGLEGDARRLLTGYITHARPDFGPGTGQGRLEIWAMDASVLLDRTDRLKAWPNKKDSDIAAEVFQEHGLTPRVTDTEIVHDERVSTVIQRETDAQLLRRLALRNGFECFVDGDTGYFRPPAVDARPQPVLAVQFGEETNVDWFRLEVNALAPATVAMTQMDHVSGEVLRARANAGTGRQPALGADHVTALPSPGDPAVVHLARTVTTGVAEMSALCQGLADRREWFVTGEGEVAANTYGFVLTPRGTVLIKGVGETHSGVYYITHVTHRFTAAGYTQRFRAKRNALRPKGDEDFAGAGPLDEIGGLQ